ncbi:MAG TPA: ferritin-like domain-containing protein [Flavobacteriales bacterium]|nr:ferritin-like domain-containing protein [Flavobacteriales bacterium]
MATKTSSKTTSATKSSAGKTSSNGSSRTGSSDSSKTKFTGSKDNETTLEDLFEEELKDIYNAEKQLVEALPKIAKAADSEDLEQAITFHLDQTKKQVERLEKIMDRLGIDKSQENECEAMKGLLREGEEIIEKYKTGPIRDAALIMAAQKVEHYEIASYGSLRELADVLGLNRECDLLNRTLQEEGQTDHDLSRIAMDINDEACAIADQQQMESEW